MKIRLFFFLLILAIRLNAQSIVWVEPELFKDKGGWVTDAQFVDQVGTPYILAHGLGNPVKDATTTITFPESGIYHVWVRTKNWIPEEEGPGKFALWMDNKKLSHTFGSDRINHWHWEYGGTATINNRSVQLRLQDLSGFEGRCDAICFSKKTITLSNEINDLTGYRIKYAGISNEIIQEKGIFDLVVAGGGVAGICAAVQAARLGLKVALINNRPILGGNSSSEIKVSTDGSTFHNKYPALGRIVREIDNKEAGIGGESISYRDEIRKEIVNNEKNITLFENMHVTDVVCEKNTIKSVITMSLLTLETHSIEGFLYADCTGDATLGIKAGADYRYGRESNKQTNERSAPAEPDNLVMGTSNQWRSERMNEDSTFPIQPWMLKFTPDYHFELTQSIWNWESGFNTWHTVNQAEEIRDHNMRAIYSNWAYIKTHKPEKYSKYKLSKLLYMAGKRESYRLVGDVLLTEEDIVNKVEYPDAIVTTTWGIDLHYPDTTNSIYFPGKEFIGYSIHPFKQQDVYTIPYRCLYSRNITNLFMAGRNISVSHIALGSVRVQRCTGMMGEVVGISAYLCKMNKCAPSGLYTYHLNQLLDFINQ